MEHMSRYSGRLGGISRTNIIGVYLPCKANTKENNPRKLPKIFERDPTVGSKVMDLLSRYSRRVGGMARIDVVGV